MDRNALEHNVYYSHYLEKMFSVATDRIDKAITFLLLLTGSAVFASYGSNVFFGFFVAFLSSASLVYEFGKRSSVSAEQAKAYHRLMIAMDKLSDDDLLNKFQEINKADTRPWNSLTVAARKRAIVARIGIDSEGVKYTKFQYIMTRLSGEFI